MHCCHYVTIGVMKTSMKPSFQLSHLIKGVKWVSYYVTSHFLECFFKDLQNEHIRELICIISQKVTTNTQ
jgi:hypothetical protein